MDAEFDWLTLDADEEVLWADTPHQYSLVPAVVVGVLLAVLLVGIVILVGAYLSHRNTNYVVTTDALYKKTGVLSRNVQRIEFGKVQDTSYRQSFLGARFGYGTVDISTAGGGGVEMRFSNVAEPQQVQASINERLRDGSGARDARDRDVDVILDEILAELRAIRSAVGAGSAEESVPGPGSSNSGLAGADDPVDGRGGTDRVPDGVDGDESEAGADGPGSPPADDEAAPEPETDPDEFQFEGGS